MCSSFGFINFWGTPLFSLYHYQIQEVILEKKEQDKRMMCAI